MRDLKLVWGKKWGIYIIILCLVLFGWTTEVDENGIAVSATMDDSIVKWEGAISSPPSPLDDIREEILPKIHILESSGGKNDSCKLKGLVNGYGYSQHKTSWRCYKSKEAVEKDVAEWFEENLQKYTLAESLCLYQSGYSVGNCGYYKKYLTL